MYSALALVVGRRSGWRCDNSCRQVHAASITTVTPCRLGSPSWDPLGPNRVTPLVRFWLGGGANV